MSRGFKRKTNSTSQSDLLKVIDTHIKEINYYSTKLEFKRPSKLRDRIRVLHESVLKHKGKVK